MKFAVVGALGLLAFILLAAGLGTPVATMDREANVIIQVHPSAPPMAIKSEVETIVSLSGMKTTITSSGQSQETSYSFSELNDQNDGKCGKVVGMAGATLAFGIIGCLLAVAGSAAGFASFKMNPLPIPLAKLGGFLLLGAAVCSLIAWPMAIAFYTAPMCSGDDAKTLKEQEFKMGPCGPLMIVAWLFLIGGGVAGVVMPDTAVAVDMSSSSGGSGGQQTELQQKLYGNKNGGDGML